MDEPIELGLRPAVSAELELINALKAEGGGAHGAITELLKACIRRGYQIVQDHARSGATDAAAHVDFEAAGAYRFKLLAMFCAAQTMEVAQGVSARGDLAPRLLDQERPELPVPAPLEPEQERAGADAAAEVGAGEGAPVVEISTTVTEPRVQATPEESGSPNEAPRPKKDWSKLRGLAGGLPRGDR